MTTFGSVVYHYVQRNDEFQRIWGNSEQSFQEHVNYFQNTGVCIGMQEVREQNFVPKKANVLLSFDDGLKEHFTYFGSTLESQEIKALFNIPTCIFWGEPPNPHVIHFITAYYGVRKFYHFVKEEMKKNFPEYLSLLPENASELEVYSLLMILKDILKRKIIGVDVRQLLLNLYKEYLLKPFPNFMERVYVSKDDVRALRKQGHTIGSHSLSHAVMQDILKDDGAIEKELTSPKETLEEILQETIDVFSYPFGSADELVENTKVFQKVGYNWVFTTCAPVSLDVVDPLRIGRYSTYSADTPLELKKNIFWYNV